jgi:hypothetical protein
VPERCLAAGGAAGPRAVSRVMRHGAETRATYGAWASAQLPASMRARGQFERSRRRQRSRAPGASGARDVLFPSDMLSAGQIEAVTAGEGVMRPGGAADTRRVRTITLACAAREREAAHAEDKQPNNPGKEVRMRHCECAAPARPRGGIVGRAVQSIRRPAPDASGQTGAATMIAARVFALEVFKRHRFAPLRKQLQLTLPSVSGEVVGA